MLPFLSRAQATLEADESWRRAALQRLRAARDELEHSIQTILEPAAKVTFEVGGV
jgi:hypothetical protein